MSRLNESSHNQEKIANAFIFSIMLLILFLICYCFPVVGDDWYYVASDAPTLGSLLYDIKNHWLNLNGRVLGNTSAIIFANSVILRAIARSSIIWGIMILVCKNSNVKKFYGYILSFVYIFTIPSEIFRQTYSWAAGFFNYVPPVLLILIYTYIIKNIFTCEKIKDTKVAVIFSFLLGVSTQLFMENITLYVVVMSISILLWHIFKYKKVSITTLVYFIGSLLGAIIMFTSPIYRSLGEKSDGYSMSFNILELLRTARKNYQTFSVYSISKNYVLIITLAILCLFILYKAKDSKLNILRVFNTCVITFTPIYFLISTKYLPEYFQIQDSKKALLFDVLMCSLLFFSVATTVIFFVRDKERKARSVFFGMSAAVSVAPLLFVNPIGPRCFYISYIFILVVIFDLFGYFLKEISIDMNFFKIPLIILAICVSAYYLSIFSKISYIENLRNNYIIEQMAQNQTTIDVPSFTHKDYLWETDGWKLGLKYHYVKTGDITFEFVPFDVWKMGK